MNKKIKLARGFTLIELLVVIAIIGILSSIILVSLNSARNKGNDAKTQEQLNSVRTAGALYYTTNGNYGASGSTADSCSAGMYTDAASNMSTLVAAGSYPSGTSLICNSNQTATAAATAFAVEASLSTSGTYWCVDSTGASKAETATIGAAVYACP